MIVVNRRAHFRYPSHLERHKRIYERYHDGDDSYTDIAHDLGMSMTNARKLAMRWERELRRMRWQNTHVIGKYHVIIR